jgi:oligopeptide/dipeptide ABC transporter ATP-binding protein
MALSLNHKLIIMDEPTTGLDVLVQYRILEKISTILEQIKSSILLITHDISIVAQMCNRIAVMYGGQLMEVGKTEEIFYRPNHPYSMGLLNAFPNILMIEKELISIPGSPPSLIGDIQGCTFKKRCPFSTQKCFEDIEMHQITQTHWSSCHFYGKSDEWRKISSRKQTWLS